MSKSVWLLTLFLFLTLVTSVWLIDNDLMSHNKQTITHLDSFMVNAQYSQFDENGNLHFQLSAKKMEHYREHDTAYFTEPQLYGFTKEGIPWQVNANYGKTTQGTHKINFWGNVILTQLSYPHHSVTTQIKTTAISVYPYHSYAETDKPVILIRGSSNASGIGMQTDFKTGIMKLLAQTKTTYLPKLDSAAGKKS